MIIDIRLPRIHWPRLHRHPSLNWQRWWVVIPRLGHIDGHRRRRLILPGRYETRISLSQNYRVWREID